MFSSLRLYSKFLKDLEENGDIEITDSFIKGIKYPDDLVLYLIPLETCLQNKNTFSVEIIEGVINLSNFLLIDKRIHKKFLDYRDNVVLSVGDQKYYVNNLEHLKFIINNFNGKIIQSLIDKLCRVGLVDSLRFIKDEYKEYINQTYYEDSMKYAADGHIKTIKFLKEEYNAPIDRSMAVAYAAMNGHIEVIKLLKEKYNAPIDEWAITYAAQNGQIETIKFLKEKYNVPIDKWAISYAAKNGQIETIKFLKEEYNAPIDEWAVRYAALRGHLEIIKLLKEEYNAPIYYQSSISFAREYQDVVNLLKSYQIIQN